MQGASEMNFNFHKLVEEIILIVLILFNVFELFGLLPGDVSVFKSMISIAGLGYVLYKASFSNIFFGEKNSRLDFLLISSYMLLLMNKIVQISYAEFQEAELMQDLLMFILENSVMLEKLGFIVGILSLIFISVHVALRVEVKEPSIMDALHGQQMHSFLKKFFFVFLILIGFYLTFFNFIMEWFTVVIDAPLVVLGLFFYIFKIHNLGKNMDSEEFLFKISEFSESFIERFIELFHEKKTIFLGISGLLVLHLMNDIGAFMLPYTLGIESVYHQSLGEGHRTLLELFLHDTSIATSAFQQVMAVIGYAMNALGMMFLLLGPGFIWYILYISKHDNDNRQHIFPDIVMALFFCFLTFMVLAPVFSLEGIAEDSESKNLVGVDIKTQSVLTSEVDLILIFALALSIFVLVTVFSKFAQIKIMLFYLMTLISIGFFGVYIFYYFSSFAQFYTYLIHNFYQEASLLGSSMNAIEPWFLMFFHMLFLMIMVIFYLGGYISFLSDVFKKE
jgi:hypothetical protein